jgi:hypothetical protein
LDEKASFTLEGESVLVGTSSGISLTDDGTSSHGFFVAYINLVLYIVSDGGSVVYGREIELLYRIAKLVWAVMHTPRMYAAQFKLSEKDAVYDANFEGVCSEEYSQEEDQLDGDF